MSSKHRDSLRRPLMVGMLDSANLPLRKLGLVPGGMPRTGFFVLGLDPKEKSPPPKSTAIRRPFAADRAFSWAWISVVAAQTLIKSSAALDWR